MFELALISLLSAPTQLEASEAINQFCAEVVGIPYASDNFSDEQWTRFVYCREHIKAPTNFIPSDYID